MELIYIWIKNYKNIDECAVALNPKFIYTKCYRQTNKTLKINLIESNNFVRVLNKNGQSSCLKVARFYFCNSGFLITFAEGLTYKTIR